MKFNLSSVISWAQVSFLASNTDNIVAQPGDKNISQSQYFAFNLSSVQGFVCQLDGIGSNKPRYATMRQPSRDVEDCKSVKMELNNAWHFDE